MFPFYARFDDSGSFQRGKQREKRIPNPDLPHEADICSLLLPALSELQTKILFILKSS